MKPTLFIDRDGTLIEEPPDLQVDRLEKIRLVRGVIPALLALKSAGYQLVMITNQDGLGTASFPQSAFDQVQDFVLRLFASQGVDFSAILICPHRPENGCSCRKPGTQLIDVYAATAAFDPAHSAVIGDRDTDMQLAAQLGLPGLRIAPGSTSDLTWAAIARRLTERQRTSQVRRRTRETEIDLSLNLDSEAPAQIATGIPFFDHMLQQIARHAGIELNVRCRGDLEVDEHHTVEDTALALGEALRLALGTKAGIQRYGFLLAMDEAQAQIALDLSGRGYFAFEGHFQRERVGGLPTELVPHFFRSFADSLGAALHISVRGENSHHMVESCFKGVGRALRQAVRIDGRELPTTKGVL